MLKEAPEQSEQSICMACGLCCDGTLFGHVDLEPEDDVVTLVAGGIQILSHETSSRFKQPCTAHKGCKCTVYPNRPRSCVRFHCVLLERFKANKISKSEALRLIREAVNLRNNVRRNMLAAFGDNAWPLAETRARLTEGWKDASVAAKKRYAEFFRMLIALQLCLDKSFRKNPTIPLKNNRTTFAGIDTAAAGCVQSPSIFRVGDPRSLDSPTFSD
jgi:hypothetical protein